MPGYFIIPQRSVCLHACSSHLSRPVQDGTQVWWCQSKKAQSAQRGYCSHRVVQFCCNRSRGSPAGRWGVACTEQRYTAHWLVAARTWVSRCQPIIIPVLLSTVHAIPPRAAPHEHVKSCTPPIIKGATNFTAVATLPVPVQHTFTPCMYVVAR